MAKLMSRAGVAAKTRGNYRCTTDSNHDQPVAENEVDRPFEPEAPNRVWTADITYIPTREGWRCLAAVEDFYSQQVVGRAMGDRIDSRLVGWWPTRTGGASTPASTTGGCSRATRSPAA